MNKNLLRVYLASALLCLSVIGAALIPWIPTYHLGFLISLVVILILTMVARRGLNRSTVTVARLLLGAVFIFSGFVKGLDPLGTRYQIEDYLMAYGMEWADFMALPLSIALNALEFTVGVMLVLNVRIRLMTWIVSLMMLFFTGVTLYDAIANPVPECGCFGKAVAMTNWQTFYKNLVLDCWVLVLATGYYLQRPPKRWLTESAILMGIASLFIIFEISALRYLPVIDFMEWKKGTELLPARTQPIQYYSVYQNQNTGEEKAFLPNEIPYNDPDFESVWQKEWIFIESKVVDPNPKGVSLVIQEVDRFDGNYEAYDITEMFLSQQQAYFILVAWDIEQGRSKGLREAIDKLQSLQADWYLFSASAPEVVDSVLNSLGYDPTSIRLCESDDTSLKAMVRSNPGLIFVNKGFVVNKWAWRSIPETEKLQTLIQRP